MRRAWLFLGLSLLVACDRDEPPREPPAPARPAGSALPEELAASVGDAAVDASAAARAVTELRRTKLALVPRKVAAERLVFGKGRLAQLGSESLVVRDTQGFAKIVEAPLDDPRRAVELADGSLLGVGSDAVVRLDRREKSVERHARIPLFAESLVFGDRRDERRVWVLHSFGSLLYQYAIGGDGGSVTTLEFLDLEGFDQRAFCALKDGSFLYTAGDKLRRFFPGGKRWELTLPEGGEVWRLLTTRRIDRVWIARSGGKLELSQITRDGVRVVDSIEIADAFDVASNDREIAVVQVRNPEGKARRWTLVVYEPSGKRRFEADLPPDLSVGAGDSWVAAITRDKTLALSTHAPLVAVGGPSWLSVWNTMTGKRVYASEP